MMKTIATTSHKPDETSLALAREAAVCLNIEFAEREKLPLHKLRERYGAANILVVDREKTRLYTLQGEYSFHPSMSVPRIKALRQGKPDHMVQAMALTTGDTVLDCTLGLGSDAIVAAFAVGPEGRVTGLEVVPELAYLVQRGLAEYKGGPARLQGIMAGIRVVCADSALYLAEQADNSHDVVYFDPMFRAPRVRSSSMEPLRGIVNPEPITPEMVREAVRVAKRRVVLKENCFSGEFARLGFDLVTGGRYSPIAFGVIDKKGGVS